MIAIEKQSRLCRCWISGAMNAATTSRMWQTLDSLLGECDEMEINISRVNWVDIDGFQWMLRAKDDAAKAGKKLRFVSGASQTQDVMNLYHFFCGLGEPLIA